MAQSIPQAFREFAANLEITGLQTSTVSARQDNIRALLARELNLLESFLTGSYRRHTMIAPLADADIDIFVVLEPQYWAPANPTSVLDRVRNVLLATYSGSKVSRNGQAVTIRFTDFVVDVVPGFKREGGGFLIPDSISRRWISTNPQRHVEIWNAANATHAGALVPLLKMLKSWNRSHSKLLRSFHLEALALSVFDQIQISDYPSGCRYFFEKAPTLIVNGIQDPAGLGGNLGDYFDTVEKLEDCTDRLGAALRRAMNAEAFARTGRVRDSLEQWRGIFGDAFPPYG